MTPLRDRNCGTNAAKRRRASNNNDGEHTQLDQDTANRNVCKRSYIPSAEADPTSELMKEEVNVEPAVADASLEGHPPEPTRQPVNDDVNGDTYKKDASSQLTPEQGRPKEDDPSPTTTAPTPNKRNVTRRSRRYHARGDLVTIYESEDEAKFESPINMQTPHRHQADNGDPGITPVQYKLSNISSKMAKKLKKCIFCLFLSLCRTASRPYRLS